MKLLRLLAILLALAPVAAQAQSTVLQAGPTVSGRLPMYSGSGGSQPIVVDSGSASGGGAGVGIKELGLTVRGTGTAPYADAGTGPNGENFCNYDAPITNATGYHYLCMSPNAEGGGLLSYGAGGVASELPLSFMVNGTSYEFPFSIGGVVGPAVSGVNNAACWNNTTGTLLKDCGAFVTVGGNNTWTGTNNFTGAFQIGGIAQTFPASGNLVGTSDTQTLTNKSIVASQINSGTLPATVMPAYTGDVTSSAGATVNAITAGAVTNAKLAAASSANTIKGAATSTAVTDLAVPSCSSANQALQWTTGVGLSCATVTASTAGFGINLTAGVFSISQTQPPYGYDVPINMGLTASVGGSNLTINVVGANGSTPSATNPVMIPFRSATVATGTPTWVAITAAHSLVIPSGATMGTSNSTPFRIWLFETYNAGAPQLAAVICSVSPIIYPCAAWETTGQTSTTITGLSTTAGVLYTTTGVSNDSVRIIGYADYASGLGTAGLYASTPTTLQLMGPGVKKPGETVQVVRTPFTAVATGTTLIPFDNTIPQNTEGDEYMTRAITPTSSPNLLSVHSSTIAANTAANNVASALFRDSTANALSTGQVGTSGSGVVVQVRVDHVVQAGSISATTFKIRVGGSVAGTTTFNGTGGAGLYGGTANSYMEIYEIMG